MSETPCSSERLAQLERENAELEEQLSATQEELFSSNNKIKLVTQEYAAYRMIQEIEQAQQQD